MFINGYDISLNFDIFEQSVQIIEEAQRNGDFNLTEEYHLNEWYKVGLLYGIFQKHLTVVVKG